MRAGLVAWPSRRLARREYPGGEFFLPCVLVIKRLAEGERHDKAQLNAVLREHGVGHVTATPVAR